MKRTIILLGQISVKQCRDPLNIEKVLKQDEFTAIIVQQVLTVR